MRDPRDDPPDLIVTAGDPRGLLDLRGGDHELQLIVRGVAAGLVWWYDGGSTGRYFAWTHTVDEAAAHVAALAAPLNADDPRPLAEAAAPWLACLQPGRYALRMSPAHPLLAAIPRATRLGSIAWYGDDGVFVETQPDDVIAPARVDELARAIAGGARPAIVLLGVPFNPDTFVLDGHHRLRAYHRLRIAPPALSIARLDAPQVDRSAALDMLLAVQRLGSDTQLTDWTFRDYRPPR